MNNVKRKCLYNQLNPLDLYLPELNYIPGDTSIFNNKIRKSNREKFFGLIL